jgi:hypothetical protein
MSTYQEQFNSFIERLGPAMSEVLLIEQVSPQLCLLALETYESAIALRLDEDTGILTLSCELGRPQEEAQFKIYEALLIYNSLSPLHGGIRMALREPGGAIVQEFDAPLGSLQIEQWMNLIIDFSKKASAWEEIIESSETPELEDLEDPSWNVLRP